MAALAIHNEPFNQESGAALIAESSAVLGQMVERADA
jgi:hypothetical protein